MTSASMNPEPAGPGAANPEPAGPEARVTVRVRLPGQLRELAGAGTLELEVPAAPGGPRLADVLDAVRQRAPAVERRIRDEQGALRQHVNVFIGETNARDLDGLTTPVTDGTDVYVLPATSGG